MDWRRAKTIFIISFILLDLFLAGQINQMIEQKSNYLKTNEISEEQIRDLLESNQIKLTTSIPDHITKIPALQAEITPIDKWDYDEKWMYHQNLKPPISFTNRQQLENTLKQKLSFFNEFQYTKNDSNSNQLTYLQRVDGHPIFDGKIRANLNNKKVESLHVLHFKVKEKVNVDFIPFTQALYNLITRENLPKGAKISNVVLGYRSMYYPNPKEVILIPVWSFTINNKPYYIYATNNNLNNEDSGWQGNK